MAEQFAEQNLELDANGFSPSRESVLVQLMTFDSAKMDNAT